MTKSRKHKRISLPNGCSISAPTIHPANWNQAGASASFDWYIHYRFYDPSIKPGEKHFSGKQCIVKGMNDFKILSERREITKNILANELNLLQVRGFNPITKEFYIPDIYVGEITERTPLLPALNHAFAIIKCEPSTLSDIKGVLKYATIAIEELQLSFLPLIEIRKKHIKYILDQCAKNQNHRAKANPDKLTKPPAIWSADRHNKYRAYLMMLFNEFCIVDAIDINPVKGSLKMKGTKTIRQVLTDKEMISVSETLEKKNYRFWLFLNIFYPSGSREAELMRLQGKKVNLEKQTFTRLVKKGKIFEEVETTITNSALPYWKIAMKDCGPDDFVFSIGLKPGKRKIRTEQISRRWRRAVKVGMNITADCYSLKHLFTSGVVDNLSDEDAANHNAHKSTAMVKEIYDYRREERHHEKMKKVPMKFSQN